jgi:hypothetical protein
VYVAGGGLVGVHSHQAVGEKNETTGDGQAREIAHAALAHGLFQQIYGSASVLRSRRLTQEHHCAQQKEKPKFLNYM